MTEAARILLIGGTEEARQLNEILADRPGLELFTSLAGRTKNPAPLKGHVVSGGFGGDAGLTRFLSQNRIQCVVDASHPFAAKMTQTAARVCQRKKVSYLRFQRPLWVAGSADYWVQVPSIDKAVEAAADHARIFLSVGRQELAPFTVLKDRFFLVRSIEGVSFEPVECETFFIRQRGPFSVPDEKKLLKHHKIDVIVTKNSGGLSTYAKIVAARELRLPVIMIDRPDLPNVMTLSSIDEVIQSIDRYSE
jgi:precorrin-6A/cobalt-precorrin-6A reductase